MSLTVERFVQIARAFTIREHLPACRVVTSVTHSLFANGDFIMAVMTCYFWSRIGHIAESTYSHGLPPSFARSRQHVLCSQMFSRDSRSSRLNLLWLPER
jgi:hypothetical protein